MNSAMLREPGSTPDDEPAVALTELEAHVLAQVAVNQPISAYDVMKALSRSPVSSLSGSTGAIYPIVKRLRERGLLTAAPVKGSPRRTEVLSCSPAGRAAAARWVGSVSDVDLLPHDPLRSKILFFSLLTKPEQMRFLLEASRALEAKLEELEQYAKAHEGLNLELASQGAAVATKARRRWLQDVLLEISQS
ncbi:MAG: PadR family transcriptional regulator [Sphingomonas sp.]|nr:PadR family transcriptional regulator [Sphingomonas sp.]MBO9713455.1 PadR family transcriptional regulator [Sphingomonas sp.]